MNLSGLSTIHRCNKTKVQDGYLGGINFSNDKFCLDGQRLINIAGTYGADGAEYRTEINQFSKIYSWGNQAGDPDIFVVKDKSGKVYEYGVAANSRIEIAGSTEILVWALNRIIDRSGNSLTFTYGEVNANSEFYPQRIDYYVSGSNVSYASVRFEYKSIPNPVVRYIAGSKLIRGERLSSIKTYYGQNQNLVFNYQIDAVESYFSNIKRYLVPEIRKCNAANVCMAPTKFTWAPSKKAGVLTTENPIAPAGVDGGEKSDFYPIDWNADGYTDILYWNSISGVNTWYINNKSGGYNKIASAINPGYINGSGETKLAFGDFNGDGLTDLLFYDSRSGGNRFFLNNTYKNGTSALSFTPYVTTDGSYLPAHLMQGTVNGQITIADFNGDALADILFLDPNGHNEWLMNEGNLVFHKSALTVPGLTDGYIQSGDFNADGISDFLWHNSTTGANKFLILDGDANQDGQINIAVYAGGDGTSHIPGGALDGGNYARIDVLDLNGDGYSDFVYYNMQTGTNHWYVNNGNLSFAKQGSYDADKNSVAPSLVSSPTSPEKGHMHFGDWNSDGMMDFVFYRSTDGQNDWYLNNGSYGFKRQINALNVGYFNDSAGSFKFGDWDGDGLPDFVYYRNGDGRNIFSSGINTGT